MDSPDDDPRTTLGRRLFRLSASKGLLLVYLLAAGALVLITSGNTIVRAVVMVTSVLWMLRIQLANVARQVPELWDGSWGRFSWAQSIVFGGVLLVEPLIAFLPAILFWPELLSTPFPKVFVALYFIGYTPALVVMAIITPILFVLFALAIVIILVQIIRAIYRAHQRRGYHYPTL